MRSGLPLGVGVVVCPGRLSEAREPPATGETVSHIPDRYLDDLPQGVSMVQHNNCLPSRHQDPMHFGDRSRQIARVMQTPNRVHAVEARVRPRDLEGRALPDPVPEILTEELQPGPHDRDRAWGDVETAVETATGCDQLSQRPGAQPDFHDLPSSQVLI